MHILNPTSGANHVLLSTVLDPEVGAALDRAAGEVGSSRAGHARRLIVEALRQSGHLPPLPTPRHAGRALPKVPA